MENLREYKRLKWLILNNKDKCTYCGKSFKDNDDSYIGHIKDGELAYMCSSCKKLSYDATFYSNSHKSYISLPEPNAKLWRYMDFVKFISLLEYKSLFFCRLDRFNDPYEGAIGIRYNRDNFKEKIISTNKSVIRFKMSDTSEDEVDLIANEKFDTFVRNIKQWRLCNFVNCWHLSEYESEAMWKLYGGNENQGIAIQTTFERLYNALPLDFQGDFGLVNYVNYKEFYDGKSNKNIHPFDAPWFKREAFAHEKEFRVIIEDIHNKCQKECSKSIQVDMHVLLESVYISPTADNYFKLLVNKIVKRYGINVPIFQSELDIDPLF